RPELLPGAGDGFDPLTVARLVFHVPFRGEPRAPGHGLRLLRAHGHRHRHLRGDDGALGDPGPAHAVLRQPAAHGALRGIHADRGHAEVDPAVHLHEPERSLRRARPGRDGPAVRAGRRVRAALRARGDRFGAGWI